jgi:U3 small nucleolar RNA-associated protein 11
MSSWKNAAKLNQNIHKERHQPQFRNHLGLLEKKQDYTVRAKDYNKKQTTLKLLKKQVLNKNPDEFNFNMLHSKVENGTPYTIKENKNFSDDQIKLMETQDIKYINFKRVLEIKKIENLHNNLHMINSADEIKNNHIFFMDGDNLKNFNIIKKFKTHPALMNRRINRPNLDNLQKMKITDFNDFILKKTMQQKHLSYKELYKRLDREQELTIIQQTLEIKQALKDTKVTKPKKIHSGYNNCAPIYKWKFERKK